MSVVINYCSNEYCFLDAMITQCRLFTDDIVVSYGSHYYTGEPESERHFETLRSTYPTVQFVEYTVDTSLPNHEMRGVHVRRNAYWHNLARWTGFCALKKKEWVFFLDVDEIPEGDRVKEFFTHMKLNPETSYKIANYWYFKLPIHQATSYEDSIVLIHARHVIEASVFGDGERDHLAGWLPCNRNVMGMNGAPLFHHYSWVRSKDMLRQKLLSWGHNTDYADPESLIHTIFKDDGVNDVIHHYGYRTVPNFFVIRLDSTVPT